MGSSAFTLFIAVGTVISAVPKNQRKKLDSLWGVMYLVVWSAVLYPAAFISYGYRTYVWMDILFLVTPFILTGFLSRSLVSEKFKELPKHKAALQEYKVNYDQYKDVVQKITILYPGISESNLLQKVLEYGVSRRPKSWAYYVGQATNKIAGHPDLEEDLKKNTEIGKNDTENIVLTDQSSESEDMMASKINKILFTANTMSAWNKNLWLHQFKLLINLKHLVGSGPACCVLNIITWPWRLLAALIPPPSLLCGTVSVIMTSGTIYAIIHLVHDITVHLGCFLLLKDCIIGFVFISACLNLPHLVAAKVAAVEEETANLPLICLLSGKCLVISVGIGLPWRLVNLISYLKHGEGIRIPVDVRNLNPFIIFGIV